MREHWGPFPYRGRQPRDRDHSLTQNVTRSCNQNKLVQKTTAGRLLRGRPLWPAGATPGRDGGSVSEGIGLTASWGRSLWHRPPSVQHQLGTQPPDTPGPVTSSQGPQAFTARSTDGPSALLPDSLTAGGVGWGGAGQGGGPAPHRCASRLAGAVLPPKPFGAEGVHGGPRRARGSRRLCPPCRRPVGHLPAELQGVTAAH